MLELLTIINGYGVKRTTAFQFKIQYLQFDHGADWWVHGKPLVSVVGVIVWPVWGRECSEIVDVVQLDRGTWSYY